LSRGATHNSRSLLKSPDFLNPFAIYGEANILDQKYCVKVFFMELKGSGLQDGYFGAIE